MKSILKKVVFTVVCFVIIAVPVIALSNVNSHVVKMQSSIEKYVK